MNIEQRRGAPEPTYSGKVFISGVGFIVTGALWALLAYFRHRGGGIDVVSIDATLSLLHLIAGVAILKRLRPAWYAGLAIALAGIGLTLVDGYFLPVICDGIIAFLLFFSRGEYFDSRDMARASRGSSH